MLKVFISYGRSDSREMAIRLRDGLQSVGYKVWLDLNEIPGGASWSQNIEEAIEHCDLAIALMSKASFDSQWCRAEQLRAIRKGKRIIPILAHRGAEIPLHLEHLNYLDFSDPAAFDAMFRDLLSDLTAGQAFIRPQIEEKDSDHSPFKKQRSTPARRGSKDEKRSTPAFRRHLAELRREEWLGARYWWPYFLFYYTDIHRLVDILTDGELLSPVGRGENFNSYWDNSVSFYFRPRPPTLWRSEGFRPSGSPTGDQYCPLPVYLLFDMEAIISHPESRFTDGDPTKTKRSFKTPAYFRELPFEEIYHDSWFMPDEREEIMRSRGAQVMIPDRVGLESLELIWVRSPAEYETLRSLLPPAVWRRWRDKVTARTDYHLFNRKWVYVQDVALAANSALFRFNFPEKETDKGPFMLTVDVTGEDGSHYTWETNEFVVSNDLMIEFQSANYEIQLLLDGDLAYAGRYEPDPDVF